MRIVLALFALALALHAPEALAGPIVLAVAGAAIGASFGTFGAQLGWMAGSMLGSLLFGKTQKIAQQPLEDLRITGTDYGQVIPWVQGHPIIAGQLMWNSDRRPIYTTTTSGGKGGGGEVETTTITYEIDALFIFADNECEALTRVFDEGKLAWTNLSSASVNSLEASEQSDLWERITFYTGSATQMPDPDYEAAVGAANAPAYRGRASVFIKGWRLGQSGRLRNLTFEVSTNATPGSPTTASVVTFSQISGGATGAIAFNVHGWIVHRQVAPGLNLDVLEYRPDTGAYVQIGSISGPGGTATGSRGNTDRSCFVFHENPPALLTMYTEESTIGVQFELPEYHQAVCFARKGDDFVCATRVGIGSKVLYRFSIAAGGVPSVTSAALGEYVNAIAIVGSDVYALQGDATHIYRLDLATLTLQETIATPVAAVGCWIFSGEDSLFYGLTGAPDDTVYERVDGAWVARGTTTLNIFGTGATCAAAIGNSVYSANEVTGTHTAYRMAPISSTALGEETVKDVVERACLRAGLAASQFDASALTAITRNVRGLAVAQVAPMRQVLELLGAVYFFEMTVSDKIYFKVRGGASAVTIPYLDLGATEGEEHPEPLALKESNEIELPAGLALRFLNASNDGQPGVEVSDRLTSAVGGTVETREVPLLLTPGESKAVVDTWMLDLSASRVTTKIALLGDYAKYEPTDPVTATAEDGSTIRLRLVQKNDAYPVQEFDAVLDDTSVLTQAGLTGVDYSSSGSVPLAADTLMELMDIPILRDADNDTGHYVAAKGDLAGWTGASIQRSPDDVEFAQVAQVNESGIFGRCTTTLGNYAGPRIFDEANVVRVNVGLGVTLSSSTRAAVLADQSVNAFLVGSECIQAVTATLISDGVYDLSKLLRGCRGTEWAMTGHAASELVVLLRTAGMRRVPMDTIELGQVRYYKGVTIGRRLSSADSEQFTNNGVGRKPFSPYSLRLTRDGSGNITGLFYRRTRLSVRYVGTLGFSAPLGEDSESYDVVIYSDGTYATVKRTISVTTNSFSYSAADQVSDFGGTQSTIYVDIFQRSAQVGRGYNLRDAA